MRKDHRFHRRAANDAAAQELFDTLEASRAALEAAYTRFNAATEPELVEACVYEISAAQARYNPLLRLVKDAAGKAAFGACTGKEGEAWV